MEGRTLAKRCAVRNRHPVAKYKGGWTEEEDQLLNKLVHEVGQGNWSPIARELNAALGKTGDGGRIGKQCRERWNHHLRPDIKKEPWTAAEEKLLVAVHRRVGNRWSKIARALPGRSENGVKNHWNATMRKREPPKAPRSPLKLYMIEIGVLKERPRGRSSKGSKSAGRGGKRSASPIDSDLSEEEADRDDDREEEGSFLDHEQTQAADGFTQEAPPPPQRAAIGGDASAVDECLAAASIPMGSVVGCERVAVPKVVLRLRRQVPLLEGLCTEEKLPGSCDQAGVCHRSSPVKALSGPHPAAGSCEEAAELLRPAKRHCSGMGAGAEAAQRRSPAVAAAAVGPSCITTGSAAGFTGWLPAEAAAACLRQDPNTGFVPVTSPTAAYSPCMPDTCSMHSQAARSPTAATHAVHMMPAEQYDSSLMAVQQQQAAAAVFTGQQAATSTTCSPTIPVLDISPEQQQQQQGFCLVSLQAAAPSAASDVQQHCSFQEASPWSPADMSTLVDDPVTQFDWWNLPSLMDDEFDLNDASLFFDYDSDIQPDLIPCQPDAWKATSSTACGTTSPAATSQAVPPYPCTVTGAWDGSSSNNSYAPSEADRLALYNARCASTMAALASGGTLTTGRTTLPAPCLDSCLTAVTTGGLLNIPKLSTDVPAGFGGPDSPLAGFGARAVGMPRVDSFCSTTTSGP